MKKIITSPNSQNPIRLQLTQLVDQKLNVGPVGAHSTWGHCSRCFSWSTWSGLPKSSGLHLQPQAKYRKFYLKPQILLIMTKHPVTSDNSAEVVKMLLC